MLLTKTHPHQTLQEEIVNTITHGIGMFLSVIALITLVIISSRYGHPLQIVSLTIYGITLVTLYTISTLYHGIQHQAAKEYLRILDHSAIYILIAGTYTPFTLISLNGVWGWTLFGIIWTLAIIGLTYKLFFTGQHPWVSTTLYLTMGWLALIAIKPIINDLTSYELFWVISGGLFYTAGIIFFAIDHKYHFSHAMWHLFVLAGSLCHFVAVYSIIG